LPRAPKVCSRCPNSAQPGRSRCDECEADRTRRATATERGYDARHRRRFRRAVLRLDPLCVCTDRSHGHGPACLRPSTRADHFPRDRRELVRLGLNPYDPRYGRGLCASCDSKQTATRQPGGWAAR
jgi:5-methylcytosine-specific restriction protein A